MTCSFTGFMRNCLLQKKNTTSNVHENIEARFFVIIKIRAKDHPVMLSAWQRTSTVWQRTSSVWQRTSSVWQRTSSVWQRTSSVWQRTSSVWQRTSSVWQRTSKQATKTVVLNRGARPSQGASEFSRGGSPYAPSNMEIWINKLTYKYICF